MVLAGKRAFDKYVAADAYGGGIGRLDLRARCQVDGNPFALVAILRLDDDGNAAFDADFTGGGPGIGGVAHGTADRHRHAGGVQQALGQLLVLRDGFGNSAGGVHFGCLDAALFAAPAKLHEAALGQAAVGDVTGDGGMHDGAGTRAEANMLVELA